MIGILCNEKRKRSFARKLHKLFRPLINANDVRRGMPLVVFSLQGLNLQQKMVTGWLIAAGKRPSAIRTKLPSIIFNLAVQRSRSEIKTVRGLIEMEDIALINITNHYNQRTIMEMLSSDSSVKRYVLPYAGPDDANHIARPLKGTNLRKVIYGRSMEGHHKRVLLLKAPELAVDDSGRLRISRIYAQKNPNADWEVLSQADRMLNRASIRIMNCINRFIPDVFFCFVDFVTDLKGIPYLLGFGGWDNKILSGAKHKDIHAKVCKNMLEYAQAFINRDIYYV